MVVHVQGSVLQHTPVIVLQDILVLSVTVSSPYNNGVICIGIGGTTYSCDCALRYTGSQCNSKFLISYTIDTYNLTVVMDITKQGVDINEHGDESNKNGEIEEMMHFEFFFISVAPKKYICSSTNASSHPMFSQIINMFYTYIVSEYTM